AADFGKVLDHLITVVGGSKTNVAPRALGRRSVDGNGSSATRNVVVYGYLRTRAEVNAGPDLARELEPEFVEQRTRKLGGPLAQRRVVRIRLVELIRSRSGRGRGDAETSGKIRRTGGIGLQCPREIEPAEQAVLVGQLVIDAIDH